MQSLLAALAVFATVLIAISSCDSDCEGEEALINANECSYYYNLLENALLNDSNNVYRLQQAFFPLSGETPPEVYFQVTITIGGILNKSCSDVPVGGMTFDPRYNNSYGDFVDRLLWRGGLDVYELEARTYFEPIVSLITLLPDIIHSQDPLARPDHIVSYIELKLDQRLPCNPRRDTTADTLANLTSWVRKVA